MTDDALETETRSDIQWYQDQIPIRGCLLNLPQIKSAYRELATLTKTEGERIVSNLRKPDNVSDDDFKTHNESLKIDAFRVTVSIVGFDGQITYGDSEHIFDSNNLPSPIRTIFFTNENSYKNHASGTEPPNRFSIWLHFDKPPLFDPYPILSEPTRNSSNATINAQDVGYYRAVQNIINSKLCSTKKWYSFIHGKFVYDAGLWIIAFPYSIYWITKSSDYLFPTGGVYNSFRLGFYLYFLALALIIYRSFFGYAKWAFPVNVLEENKDRAYRHRIILGAIVFSLFISGIEAMVSLTFLSGQ
ncbi:MAG: hypothetical protein H6878_14065 [Rhodobiaceae bacterium]|nr:hypothetical protein [Rhodobiaceae bacterium]